MILMQNLITPTPLTVCLNVGGPTQMQMELEEEALMPKQIIIYGPYELAN